MQVPTAGQSGGNIDFPCVDCGAFFELKSYLRYVLLLIEGFCWFLLTFHDLIYSRRLHNETNCGRNQIWTCNLCCPKLLTEDAYTAHMKKHHAAHFEGNDTHVIANVENMLIENEHINPINCVEARYGDPLHSIVKEETGPANEYDRIMLDNNLDEYAIDQFLPEENPIEK